MGPKVPRCGPGMSKMEPQGVPNGVAEGPKWSPRGPGRGAMLLIFGIVFEVLVFSSLLNSFLGPLRAQKSSKTVLLYADFAYGPLPEKCPKWVPKAIKILSLWVTFSFLEASKNML